MPTHAYEFNDPSPPTNLAPQGIDFPFGAYHASELPSLFDSTTLGGHASLTPDQEQLAASMVRYWTQFAGTGDPNSAANPEWPAFTAANDTYQSLVPPTPHPETGFAADHKCAFWDAQPVRSVLEIGGRRLPFLRWSVLRMALGSRKLLKDWQVGDGREEALADYVVANARRGDPDDVIRVIDDFCMNRSVMINVGDEKGEILDRAVRRASPQLVPRAGHLLRIQRLAHVPRRCLRAPGSARSSSARRTPRSPGASGTTRAWRRGDRGRRDARRRWSHDRSPDDRARIRHGALDFVFIDHDKAAYLPDLERIIGEGWLHPGSIVVADNVRFPGAPEYRAHSRSRRARPGGRPSTTRTSSTSP